MRGWRGVARCRAVQSSAGRGPGAQLTGSWDQEGQGRAGRGLRVEQELNNNNNVISIYKLALTVTHSFLRRCAWFLARFLWLVMLYWYVITFLGFVLSISCL